MKAYVTLLSNGEYLPGVLALDRALKKVKTKYPFYCVLSKGLETTVEAKLLNEGIPCIRLSSSVMCSKANSMDSSMSHWNFTFDKLKIWGLTQFEKIVFLDSDMLILRNLDSLFLKKGFTATCAGRAYPGNESWVGLNSGLIVIEPDIKVEEELVKLSIQVVDEFKKENKFVGDQDVIQRYIPDWFLRKELVLDEGYNLFAYYLRYYIRKLGYTMTGSKGKPIYVVHFVGKTKPWMKPNFSYIRFLLKSCLTNPYYFVAYRRYLRLLK